MLLFPPLELAFVLKQAHFVCKCWFHHQCESCDLVASSSCVGFLQQVHVGLVFIFSFKLSMLLFHDQFLLDLQELGLG